MPRVNQAVFFVDFFAEALATAWGAAFLAVAVVEAFASGFFGAACRKVSRVWPGDHEGDFDPLPCPAGPPHDAPTKPDAREPKIAEQETIIRWLESKNRELEAKIAKLEAMNSPLMQLGKRPAGTKWAEKKAAIIAMLRDPELTKMSTKAIARATGASGPAVGKLRRQVEAEEAEAKASRLAASARGMFCVRTS